MQYVLDIIKNNMPPDTIICRIAGDEFAFITPGYNKEETQNYINQINERLKTADKTKTFGLTITLATTDTKDSNTISDLYSKSESIVTNQKNKVNDSTKKNPSEILYDKCHKSFLRFFEYYRLNDEKLPKKFYKIFKLQLLELLCELGNDKIELNSNNTNKKNTSPDIKPLFTQENAKNIHQLLTVQDQQNNIPTKDLDKLYNSLIRSPLLPQAYSLNYFDIFLQQQKSSNPNDSLSITYIDIMHMKLLNDLKGHEHTDDRMAILLGSVINSILQKHNNNNNLNTVEFFIRGGTLVVAEKKDCAIPDIELTQIINNAREKTNYLDAEDDPKLNVVFARKNFKTNTDSNLILDTIKQLCEHEKNAIKIETMLNENIMSKALHTALNDALSYYIESFNFLKTALNDALSYYNDTNLKYNPPFNNKDENSKEQIQDHWNYLKHFANQLFLSLANAAADRFDAKPVDLTRFKPEISESNSINQNENDLNF